MLDVIDSPTAIHDAARGYLARDALIVVSL